MCFEEFPPLYISPAGAASSVPHGMLLPSAHHIWSLWPHGFNHFCSVKWLGGAESLSHGIRVGLHLFRELKLGIPVSPGAWQIPCPQEGTLGFTWGCI